MYVGDRVDGIYTGPIPDSESLSFIKDFKIGIKYFGIDRFDCYVWNKIDGSPIAAYIKFDEVEKRQRALDEWLERFMSE